MTGCETSCQGCQWTATVSSSTQGTNCVFDWMVQRQNCDFQSDKTFSGSATVPCNERTVQVFHCDGQSQCPGYELTLIGDTCPIGPGDPPS